MLTDIDYRKLEHRWEGFDWYYKFTTQNADSTADLVCENHVANELDFTDQSKVALAFWFGAMGSPSSSIFAHKFGNFNSDSFPSIMNFFEENKGRISFASDAKYRKIHFKQFIESVCNSLGNKSIYDFTIEQLWKVVGKPSDMAYDHYKSLHINCLENWWQWGRMGQWCFSEALNTYTLFKILPDKMEFGPEGKSHTAGWVLANEKRWLDSRHTEINEKAICEFEDWADSYINRTHFTHTLDVNYYTLETACCNYKRQHKGSRYAGCYIDELYDDLQTLKEDWPEYDFLYSKFMEARKRTLPSGLLYENSKDFDSRKPAYQKSWHNAFKDYGRIPRVEAWANNQTQRWCDITELGYEENLGEFWS